MRLNLIVGSLALVLAGCTGTLEPIDNENGGGGGGGGGADAGTGGGGNAASQAYFEQNIQPMFVVARPKGTCATCHQGTEPINGPDFLGTTTAENYDTLAADTRLVGTTPATSLLITKGDHPTGDAFCDGPGSPYADCVEDEITLLEQWVALENE